MSGGRPLRRQSEKKNYVHLLHKIQPASYFIEFKYNKYIEKGKWDWKKNLRWNLCWYWDEAAIFYFWICWNKSVQMLISRLVTFA